MTTAVSKVLVIGGGFSGMAAAIQLRKAGIAVDLVEIDPDWQPLGAGITVSGATLRALETLGVYPEVVEQGWVSDGVDLHTFDGTKMAELPTPRPVGSGVAGGGGIMRPVLAGILARATRAAGVNVRLGCSFTTLDQDATGVNVGFTDGSQRRYDLVVGADGVHSKLRALLFPEVKPLEYIGQGVWRAVMPRPAEIVRPRMWFGQHIKLGVNPVSKTRMYMFITEDRPTKEHIDDATWPQVFADLMRPFTDPLVQALIPRALEPEPAPLVRGSVAHRVLASAFAHLRERIQTRVRIVLIGNGGEVVRCGAIFVDIDLGDAPEQFREHEIAVLRFLDVIISRRAQNV